jgi:hypothetical protein
MLLACSSMLQAKLSKHTKVAVLPPRAWPNCAGSDNIGDSNSASSANVGSRNTARPRFFGDGNRPWAYSRPTADMRLSRVRGASTGRAAHRVRVAGAQLFRTGRQVSELSRQLLASSGREGVGELELARKRGAALHAFLRLLEGKPASST